MSMVPRSLRTVPKPSQPTTSLPPKNIASTQNNNKLQDSKRKLETEDEKVTTKKPAIEAKSIQQKLQNLYAGQSI
jgi:hypothetical protein